MGDYTAGMDHAHAAGKLLEPHSTVLVKENEVCRAYQTALELLVEMKEVSVRDDVIEIWSCYCTDIFSRIF
jgi:broad specificity phosphatase PhoE